MIYYMGMSVHTVFTKFSNMSLYSEARMQHCSTIGAESQSQQWPIGDSYLYTALIKHNTLTPSIVHSTFSNVSVNIIT